MKLLLRILAPLCVLGVCLAIAAWLMATKPQPDTRTPPPMVTAVEALRLEPRDYQVIIPSQGTVRPRTESTLRPEVSGRILSISPSFRDGGFFEQGDVLATIDPSDYETAVVVAQATLAQKKGKLELEKAEHEQAQENWGLLGDGTEPSPLTLREPQLAEAVAAVASAESSLVEAQRNLERTRIKAPYVGRILKKEVDVGQYVSPGNVLASIFAVDYVEVRLPLRNEHLDFIHLPEEYRGDPASAPVAGPDVVLRGRLGSKEESWQGVIVRAEGAYDAKSRELFVVAQVDDPYARHGAKPPLKVGQFVEAEIQGKVLQGVFVLPRSAVRDDHEALIIDSENKIERRELNMLWKDARHVVVRDNLQAGELLCATPLAFAVDGIVVRPQIEGEASPSATREGRGPKASNKEALSGKPGQPPKGRVPQS